MIENSFYVNKEWAQDDQNNVELIRKHELRNKTDFSLSVLRNHFHFALFLACALAGGGCDATVKTVKVENKWYPISEQTLDIPQPSKVVIDIKFEGENLHVKAYFHQKIRNINRKKEREIRFEERSSEGAALQIVSSGAFAAFGVACIGAGIAGEVTPLEPKETQQERNDAIETAFGLGVTVSLIGGYGVIDGIQKAIDAKDRRIVTGRTREVDNMISTREEITALADESVYLDVNGTAYHLGTTNENGELVVDLTVKIGWRKLEEFANDKDCKVSVGVGSYRVKIDEPNREFARVLDAEDIDACEASKIFAPMPFTISGQTGIVRLFSSGPIKTDVLLKYLPACSQQWLDAGYIHTDERGKFSISEQAEVGKIQLMVSAEQRTPATGSIEYMQKYGRVWRIRPHHRNRFEENIILDGMGLQSLQETINMMPGIVAGVLVGAGALASGSVPSQQLSDIIQAEPMPIQPPTQQTRPSSVANIHSPVNLSGKVWCPSATPAAYAGVKVDYAELSACSDKLVNADEDGNYRVQVCPNTASALYAYHACGSFEEHGFSISSSLQKDIRLRR